MMKKSILLLAFFSILAFNSYTQIPDKTTEKPYIDVQGSAEMEVVPDEIYLYIRLQERKQSKTALQQEIELKTRLANVGINLENLSVKGFTGKYGSASVFKKDMLEYKEYTLKIATGKQLDSVFHQLDILDVQEARIERLSHSKMPEFRKEVKIKAIKAAKEKADYLLEAIGEQTGKPIYIIENQDDYALQEQVQYRSNKMKDLRTGGDFSESYENVEFQKIRIRFTISARFSIK